MSALTIGLRKKLGPIATQQVLAAADAAGAASPATLGGEARDVAWRRAAIAAARAALPRCRVGAQQRARGQSVVGLLPGEPA